GVEAIPSSLLIFLNLSNPSPTTSVVPPLPLSYGMHTTFCDCPLTETLDFANLLTFSGVA
ncbi:MAG: hypothetical protein VXA39_13235, partial [Deltaproteobacteria bacterium]